MYIIAIYRVGTKTVTTEDALWLAATEGYMEVFVCDTCAWSSSYNKSVVEATAHDSLIVSFLSLLYECLSTKINVDREQNCDFYVSCVISSLAVSLLWFKCSIVFCFVLLHACIRQFASHNVIEKRNTLKCWSATQTWRD